MPQLLPATGDALHGIDYRVTTRIAPGQQEQVTRVESGPRDLIAARLIHWKGQATVNADISDITHEEAERGRSSLTITFAPIASTYEMGQNDDFGVQELRAYDNEKDIRLAPYFAAMSNAQIDAVVAAWEQHAGPLSGGTALQAALYGHLAHGQQSYIETTYEFTQTFRATAQKTLNAAASNPNTVQPLPPRSPTMQKLIDSLPAGEWLKKPTQVSYAGNYGWIVTQCYQWALKWSVIYGGTFTGT